ncbi:tyrosine-type recombinase/integrase [Vibrio metschnikovii]|uniref:tyrosine-type recombinase/integrase n=1 Tax=Vibrio metschnikovii TaxID=28172 RepID=UPI00243003A8|nr:tyrosine-type recombinase/integrase [Vibrio metschnikovii]ELF5344836.1 tyrosine-type recombinase/integrase [Vibrio metschnikovii]MDM7486043.1 tyrosine-type recombinase/integrase [Vibrio metschnikovii]
MADSSNQIVKLRNQVTLSQLKSKEDVGNKWRENKSKLKRFKLEFPDLSNSFAPDWHELPKALLNLKNFEEDRGGYSINTLKMLSFVVGKWDKYCKNESVYSFPINENILLNWLKEQRLNLDIKINTLKQYRAQISLFLNIMGVEDVTKKPIVKNFFNSLAKDEVELTGSQLIELQAKPFRKHHLVSLMSIWSNEQNVIQYRDLTVLTVAYGTMLREAEIGSIRKKHITILANGDVNIERVTSKTSINPEPKRLTGKFSLILKRYLNLYCESLDDDDFVFCWLTKKGLRPVEYRQVPMSGMTIDRIYRRAHEVLKQSSDTVTSNQAQRNTWSGHSSRVGALQDGYQAGLNLTQLIQLGDWKSNEMVLRYLRGLNNDQSPNLLLQD